MNLRLVEFTDPSILVGKETLYRSKAGLRRSGEIRQNRAVHHFNGLVVFRLDVKLGAAPENGLMKASG